MTILFCILKLCGECPHVSPFWAVLFLFLDICRVARIEELEKQVKKLELKAKLTQYVPQMGKTNEQA